MAVEKVRITAEEFAAQARDKTEIYHKVSHDWGIYVPHVDQITTWHMRDLSTGIKKPIRSHEIKHLHVPSYEHLALDDFLDYIKAYPFVQMCLPDKESETKKMGRQYLINVIYTRLGDKFKKWVDERVNERHSKIKDEGKKYIDLDPEMAKLFHSSKAVSTSNGKAYHLFKASAKRCRTK